MSIEVRKTWLFPCYTRKTVMHTQIYHICMLYMCVSCPSTPLEQFAIYEFPKVTISLGGFAVTFFPNNFYKWFRRKFTEK